MLLGRARKRASKCIGNAELFNDVGPQSEMGLPRGSEIERYIRILRRRITHALKMGAPCLSPVDFPSVSATWRCSRLQNRWSNPTPYGSMASSIVGPTVCLCTGARFYPSLATARPRTAATIEAPLDRSPRPAGAVAGIAGWRFRPRPPARANPVLVRSGCSLDRAESVDDTGPTLSCRSSLRLPVGNQDHRYRQALCTVISNSC